MKRLIICILIFFSITAFPGCVTSYAPEEEHKDSTVRIHEIPDGADEYGGAEITVEGKKLPV